LKTLAIESCQPLTISQCLLAHSGTKERKLRVIDNISDTSYNKKIELGESNG
jgi:hypothetical protein